MDFFLIRKSLETSTRGIGLYTFAKFTNAACKCLLLFVFIKSLCSKIVSILPISTHSATVYPEHGIDIASGLLLSC